VRRILLFLLSSIYMFTVVEVGQGMSVSEPEAVILPIVMYHHLSEKKELLGDYVITPGQFERDLAYLQSEGYESISLQRLLAWYGGNGDLPEKPMMITFDDAYESTAIYAKPILEKYGYTGIVAIIGSVTQRFSEADDHEEYSHLSWDAVRELESSGVFEIQCHTWNMHKLENRRGCGRMPEESSESYAKELYGDLNHFERVRKENGINTCGGIAFPYGIYSAETVELIRGMGYMAAFTCNERLNVLTGDPEKLFDLSRYNRPHGKSSSEFFSTWDI